MHGEGREGEGRGGEGRGGEGRGGRGGGEGKRIQKLFEIGYDKEQCRKEAYHIWSCY